MRIDSDLATALARGALLAPYRQIQPMTTGRFADWLTKRGIWVGDWTTLHHLWQVGMLHPVAIRDVAWNGSPIPILKTVPDDRLLLVGEDRDGRVYADLGVDVPEDAPLHPRRRVSAKLRDALLWHPFELWLFNSMNYGLSRRDSWGLVLGGPGYLLKQRRESWRWAMDHLRESAEDDLHRSFLRLLALLLEVEPLVHGWVFPRVTLDVFKPGIRDYYEWRNGQVGDHALATSGLTLADAEAWHSRLAWAATSCDPVRRFRKLLRHADRDERDHLAGDALRAHTLYDAAELLRRYLEVYHGRLLPEETDLDFPERNARINLERYGDSRVTDYRRDVVRRIVRRFGVDPGYPTYLIVEGSTEVGFVRRWAQKAGADLDRAGVRVVSLRGIGNVEVFEDQLRRLREDEVFAIVCLDHDPPDGGKRATHVKKLEQYQRAGLLPVDFEVWNPNFVQRNFTVSEIVAIANGEAERHGLAITLTIAEVDGAMANDDAGTPRKRPKTVEDAINGLAYERLGHPILRKGEGWGQALADWAAQNQAPAEKATKEGLRPIEAVIAMSLRGRYADYTLTVQREAEARQTQSPADPSERICPD